ncbi:MAG: EAL domain-containing protein [Porticoccaceae bacterium]
MSSSKDELYKLLLETSPFGVIFFVYGVCVDANPKAQQMLGCDRKTLLGSSLDDFDSDEPIGLATFKECLDTALQAGENRVEWSLQDGEDGDILHMDIRSVSGGSRKEIVVTLYNAAELAGSSSATKPATKPVTDSTVQQAVAEPTDTDTADVQTDMQVDAETENAEVDWLPLVRATTAADPIRESILQKLTGMSGSSRDVATLQPEKGLVASADKNIVEKVFAEVTPAAKTRSVMHDRRKSPEGDSSDWGLYHDGLTGLPNRQALLDSVGGYLGTEFDTAHNQPVCAVLMLIDLDHFKDINDSWGHNVGDQVLVKIARVLSKLVTEDTMLARMSGDEFLFFMPLLDAGLTEGAYRAQEIANSVRELVASPVFCEGNEFILTASIGISLVNDAAVSPERALQYADTAMYEAKRKGRNGFAFFDPSISAKAHRQIGLNTRLRKAVDNQEFALYIQPQIAITDGRLVGGEALLRWVNADRVTNMPAEFIPPLEASGLIVDVGHWVIRTACENLRSFIDDGLWRDDMKLGINISPRQFKDPQLIDVIKHSISSYDIKPAYLNFEVTENLVIEDVADTIKKMEAIKALGAQFSIDDFGIGYSSMIYLKRLPFDWLKIDREFIYNVHRDPDSRGIVEAILAVSKQYGLRVIAEGVEEQGSLDVLRQTGCETYQGALFSMPVPVEQFRHMLAA